MVMADGGDRDRATFARRKFRPKQDLDYDNDFPSGSMRNDRINAESSYSAPKAGVVKIPKILTKSSAVNQVGKSSTGNESSVTAPTAQVNHVDRGGYSGERGRGYHAPPTGGSRGYNTSHSDIGITAMGVTKPVSLLRKDNVGGANHVVVKGRGQGIEPGVASSQVQQQQQQQGKSAVSSVDTLRAQLQLPPTTGGKSVKLVDESLSWCEAPFELMMDQSNFLVIGCLGAQGVGKSTIMSHLTSNARNLSSRMFAFKEENRDARDNCAHMTVGVDMCVTQERTILLDTQALLSASVQDSMAENKYENKYSADYSPADNSVELQSMQVSTFLMTVCHVVIIVANDFTDINFIRFLRLAEMLKPTTPSHKNPMATYDEYYPYVVFVQNKSNSQDFQELSIQRLDTLLQQAMMDSKLIYRGMPDIRTVSSLARKQNKKGARIAAGDNVNIFLLPVKNSATHSADGHQGNPSPLTGYRGNPGFDVIMNVLRRQLMSMPRRNLAHTMLSEKNWFHYAARTWDVVRKQQQLSEYTRLLS